MIFGGLIIGAAVQETGFGHTLASGLLRIFPRSYFGILCGITVVGTVLCFIIPSNTGRIVIMMPIFMALADQVGFEPGSRGRAGMGLAVAAGSVYPSLRSSACRRPQSRLAGRDGEHSQDQIHLRRISDRQFSGNRHCIHDHHSNNLQVPFSRPYRGCRKRSSASPSSRGADQTNHRSDGRHRPLADTDFAHGVSPAWVALGAAVLCMLPRVGMVPPSIMIGKISYARGSLSRA